MSDIRAPEAYPTNVTPVDSKFQTCSQDCLTQYAKCTKDNNEEFIADLQAAPISACRTTYRSCMMGCRKKYNEIFN